LFSIFDTNFKRKNVNIKTAMKEKLTKIIATISDKNCDVEFLSKLYCAGMNVVRLNTAHQQEDQALKVINNVRAVSDKIPIMIDTKGPEIRTTETENPIMLKQDTIVYIDDNPELKSNQEVIQVTYKGFVNEMPIGKSILIDDGMLELQVIDKQNDKLVCKVFNDGELKSRKSVNVPGVYINLPSLTEKDVRFIEFAINNDIDFIAHSFVRTKEDILAIKEILKKANKDIKIIAKIENQVGVDNIDEILDHAYGVMVARGDLGIEVAAERIPGIQKYLIEKCTQRKRPVIIATQMLHSMIEQPRPTRAEVSDVANAIYQETDAIMLSGETASGKYPLKAVETMTKIALEVENSREVLYNNHIVSHDNKIAVLLAESAVNAAMQLPVKAHILDTLTGRTARYLAAFRGNLPVYAMAYSKRVMRELALSYGVYAEHIKRKANTDDFKKDLVSFLLTKHSFKSSDLITVIGGSFGPRGGATFLEINTIQDLLNSIES